VPGALVAERAAFDDRVVAQARAQIVDHLLNLGRAAALGREQVARVAGARLDQALDADPDQPVGGAVGLARQQVARGAPQLVGELGRRRQGQAPRQELEGAGLELEGDDLAGALGALEPARDRLGERPQLALEVGQAVRSSSKVVSADTLFIARTGSTVRSSSPWAKRASRWPIAP